MGVEPTDDHEGLSFAALPVCVPCHSFRASPMGFEPTISTVTGWRALRAALRGRDLSIAVAQVGGEPTASLVLSRGGLPVAYRAVVFSTQSRSRTCKRPATYAERMCPSRNALPIGVSGHRVAEVVPDGIEPSFPGCEPSVVAVGPRDYVNWTHPELHRDLWHATPASSCWTMSPSCGAEAVRLELTNDACRHLLSKQAPHPAG